MVDDANIAGLTRESGKIIAAKLVVVVFHGIGEASDDGFGDICTQSARTEVTILLGSPLFFGCVDLE